MSLRLWRLATSGLGAVLFLITVSTLAVTKADPLESDCDSEAYQFTAYGLPALQKKYDKSIVLISCEVELPEYKSIGTGFLIDSKTGLFLTALHVIRDDDSHNYNCVTPDKRIFAYAMGDMCERTELEFVADDVGLDVALLRVKMDSEGSKARALSNSNHPFLGRQHLELLTRGMIAKEIELELIGFSQFAAILRNAEIGSAARRKLPADAGGYKCTGQPQPYKFNPLVILNQKIDGKSPSFLREASVREGDSGAPVFLSDGRVAGIITKIGIGAFSEGTWVTSASDIVKWLVALLGSRSDLSDGQYSLETWTKDSKLYDALNPDICVSSISCLPNIRIAAELQRIAAKSIDFNNFTKQQKVMLGCPLYTAAKIRDIYPQSNYLKEKLVELGVQVAELPGYLFVNRAKAILTSSKYTVYTKMAALELAEASLAKDLDSVWHKEPTIIMGAICNSGVGADQVPMIEGTLDDYLNNFRKIGSTAQGGQFGICPTGGPNPARLKQVKELTAMIADVKIAQSSLINEASPTGNAVAPTSAIGLAALFNFGDKKGAKTLIDFGDAFVSKRPDVAAGAYATAYKIEPTNRALAAFSNAVERSPKLRTTMFPSSSPRRALSPIEAISSLPKIDQHFIASTIVRNPGIQPGRI